MTITHSSQITWSNFMASHPDIGDRCKANPTAFQGTLDSVRLSDRVTKVLTCHLSRHRDQLQISKDLTFGNALEYLVDCGSSSGAFALRNLGPKAIAEVLVTAMREGILTLPQIEQLVESWTCRPTISLDRQPATARDFWKHFYKYTGK